MARPADIDVRLGRDCRPDSIVAEELGNVRTYGRREIDALTVCRDAPDRPQGSCAAGLLTLA